MNFVLPLDNERKLYHFDKSDSGKKLKENKIYPILNNDKKFISGVVYVKSKLQKDEYFKLDTFLNDSQDKWIELFQEFVSKIGATSIKTTLESQEKKITKSKSNTDEEYQAQGWYNSFGADSSIQQSNTAKQEIHQENNSKLEMELTLNGNSNSITDVEKWIEDMRINLDDNYIFRTLFENFKNNNLRSYEQTIEVEKITSSIDNVNKTIKALAGIKSPLVSADMQCNLEQVKEEEFQKYKGMKLVIKIDFKQN